MIKFRTRVDVDILKVGDSVSIQAPFSKSPRRV
jgi:hypothetical protein